ncbi:PHA/PHB synthase family protein [Leisingera sp. D0M16]|uniref:PHA/PHB synthase family protein n=1 Tax=Leisingera coralii TaxID=3351347 RepID=UPI003B7D658A
MEFDVQPKQWSQFAALSQRAAGLMMRLINRAALSALSQDFNINDVQTIWTAYARTWARLATSPEVFLPVQAAALNAMSDFFSGKFGGPDRRFRDKKWEADPIARTLRDSHIALEKLIEASLKALPEGSKDHLRVQFYTRQIISALSPSNFFALNPSARERLLESEGQSLLDGFENLLDDLEKGDGRLDITTNNPEAFTVGKDLANTPGKVVYQTDLMQLIQYEPRTKQQWKTPILLVPAWINKYYIFDLREENSFVRYLLDQGHTVFVISWVNPDKHHAEKDFSDYMSEGPLAAMDAIEKATGEKQVNVIGFCIGGILVTATAAYLAATGQDRMASATTLATMIDFREVGEIGVFIDQDRVAALREHMADKGYLENYHLQDMFSMIRENDMVWSYHVNNYLMGRKPPAFDLLFWNSDSTRLPAKMLLWYLEEIYIKNSLREDGGLELRGVPISVSQIKTPFFVLATKEDHIAPWKSVYPTTQIVPDATFVLGGSGHIAGVINPPQGKVKYGYWVLEEYPENPEDWLKQASPAAGSWWPYWQEWLAAHTPQEKVPARKPGAKGLKALEDAPGSYVLSK